MKNIISILSFVFLATFCFGQSLTESQEEAWQSFKGKYGNNWVVKWENELSTPKLVWIGTAKLEEDEPEKSAWEFLNDNSHLFK